MQVCELLQVQKYPLKGAWKNKCSRNSKTINNK